MAFTSSTPTLDAVWVAKRDRDVRQERLARQMRAAMWQWSVRRGRLQEEIVRRQAQVVAVRKRPAITSSPHATPAGWSGDSRRPWAIDAARHDVELDAVPPVIGVATRGDLAAISQTPAQLWHTPMSMTAGQIIEQRQGPTRSLFNPQQALTIDLGGGVVAARSAVDPPTAHVQRCRDMLAVDVIRRRIAAGSGAVHVGRGVLEPVLSGNV